MISRTYHFKDEIIEALDKYERDSSLSPTVIIENFLEELLYHKGYLTYEINEEEIQTPFELNNERKKLFKKYKWKDNVRIKKGDLNFGSFKLDMADEVINKLMDYTDEELVSLSKNNWEYPNKHYCSFLLSKLDDETITPESFMKNISLVTCRTRKNHKGMGTEFLFKNRLIALFSHDKYTQSEIDKAKSFLDKQDAETLDMLIDKRKKLKETSAKFLLKQMKKIDNEGYSDELEQFKKSKKGEVIL